MVYFFCLGDQYLARKIFSSSFFDFCVTFLAVFFLSSGARIRTELRIHRNRDFKFIFAMRMSEKRFGDILDNIDAQ